MKERPILFSAPMVRAILDGRKTQTRRSVRLPRHYDVWIWHVTTPDGDRWKFEEMTGRSRATGLLSCPYGGPGDRLWVRETWYDDFQNGEQNPAGIYYRADGEPTEQGFEDLDGFKWRPSIFLPRWASRITLEVTEVRVERLQAITAKDIIAEGAVARRYEGQFGQQPVSAFDGKAYLDLLSLWAEGWDSINGKRAPWASNPWVWVVEFRRLP